MVSCAVSTSPQRAHRLPSVRPGVVQVAATAGSASGAWTLAGMVSVIVSPASLV